MILDEDDLGGAAAQGLNADAPVPRKDRRAGAGYITGQDVEECFAQAVAVGLSARPLRLFRMRLR